MALPRTEDHPLDGPPAATRVVRRPRRRHRCPRCGAEAVIRTGRQGPLERLYLSLASQRPYRCRECEHRFYDRPL